MIAQRTLLTLGSILAAGTIPASGMPSSLAPRGKADIVRAFLEVIGVFTDDTAKDAWDFQANDQMCEVRMQTKDGIDCLVTVECQDGGKQEYKDFNVCFVGGRQVLNDPRIGEFAVTWTKKDGSEGEGLTDPILQVGNVGDFRDFQVTAMSLEFEQADRCEAGIAPINCHPGPWICQFVTAGNTNIRDDRTKRWRCGVPKLGSSFPADIPWEDILNGDSA